jgi:hypothetical protein
MISCILSMTLIKNICLYFCMSVNSMLHYINDNERYFCLFV